MQKYIFVKGAKENNLKNIDVRIPKDKLVVLTGISGSGKTTLAFDTIYAEGQRRYVESLSSYARQFLGLMNKPDVEYIEGLSPSISINQKTTSHNPRSTVGTITEIYDYLRLLYARIGIPHCHICGREISSQSIDQIIDSILLFPEGTKIMVNAPIVKAKKGEFQKLFDSLTKQGYTRVIADSIQYDLNEDKIKLDKNKRHDITLIVDRLIIREGIRKRLTESVETALNEADGIVLINKDLSEDILFSTKLACPDCSISIDDLTPAMFSFNSPLGACEKCTGLGVLLKADSDLIIPDRNISVLDGAFVVAGMSFEKGSMMYSIYKMLSKKFNFDMECSFNDLPLEVQNILLYGTDGNPLYVEYETKTRAFSANEPFEGILRMVERRYKETAHSYMRAYYEGFMSDSACPECNGKRLKPEILAVTVSGININEVTQLSVNECIKFFDNLKLTEMQQNIAEILLKEIKVRLKFLADVGLDYLTLSRNASTLSGGEAQRIRLATQIGSKLTGVIYILDEPSIGLHQMDNIKLLNALKEMRDLGNTLIVVEHDIETITEADYVIDIGPGAGIHGGEIVGEGSVQDLINSERSITGKYLSGELEIKRPEKYRPASDKFIEIYGARQNNLKNIDVKIPLGIFVCVTGVSGSGKSSLINEILYKELAFVLNGKKIKAGEHDRIEGMNYLDKVINIDQSPIGRTPRSNPATYVGVFNDIREIFAMTKESKARGYKKGRFSFNVKGGRCESCSGDGVKKIEMHFLPDVFVTCEVCKGKRYNRETLEVKYDGKNISDVLDMTIEEAYDFFKNIPQIESKLRVLMDVGLGYIRVGQSSTTLSGGEAQRVKLAYELSKRSTGKTMYMLDEPTTGLHIHDVKNLLKIIDRLIASGNSVIIIEHNLDVIKCADYIIDLGPGGGDMGGNIIAEGTVDEIMNNKNSYTGIYLKKYLGL
ncbi:MAG TPA: excinuclease ABC subunit UvrA [Clostridia bacterium]|jgi:excinuclease ABC subunit A|nr:excinuclease ABC subunit UvrA [Clostridiaceae bacterium]HOF25846.1 excinuclease ABC subunit UvrA [Clostridia bacterium]HOM33711.1 excinuclease ABC subunit UvrA [Clostridia bacterium]HOR88871.1 excinuclease ABC subunit UvrA [Clostridia bacterium]HOT71102.1 excinuclease ABC subunit UvrA [Clostridia bacterium]